MSQILSLKKRLQTIVGAAFNEAGFPLNGACEIVDSQRPELGQFQCNQALAMAKAAKTNPRAIADKVVAILQANSDLTNVTVAGPGFINISVTDDFLAKSLLEISNEGHYTCQDGHHSEKVVIDYGGPNVAKPMHVGHLRSSVIGECLKRLCRFMGDDVTADIHMGDWGTQMGMLIYELKRLQPDLPYFADPLPAEFPKEPPVTIDDLNRMYPEVSGRCKENDEEMAAAHEATAKLQAGHKGYRALWQHFRDISVEALKRDFGSLDVSFDLWNGESDEHPNIPPMLEQLKNDGHLINSEGAYVVPVEENNDEMPPLLLVKSDGAFLYGTTDLSTINQRVKSGAQTILYVVDKRQSLHFQQLFRGAKKTGIAPSAKLEHIAFGTVNGPDGKPFKTRAGGVMKLQDLIAMAIGEAAKKMGEANIAQDSTAEEREKIAQQIGIAALKFADLDHFRLSDYSFDIDKFTTFEGKTGPYLLYNAVRIKSILRRCDVAADKSRLLAPQTAEERGLLLTLHHLPEKIIEAYNSRTPHILCDQAYDVAKDFSRFYKECHILSESNPERKASLLALCQLTLEQLSLLADILGISIPERM